jgi:hypothetical protein
MNFNTHKTGQELTRGKTKGFDVEYALLQSGHDSVDLQ